MENYENYSLLLYIMTISHSYYHESASWPWEIWVHYGIYICPDRPQQKRLNHACLVGGFKPSEKYERQLGWWHSQYMETSKSCSKPPASYFIEGSIFYIIGVAGWDAHLKIWASVDRVPQTVKTPKNHSLGLFSSKLALKWKSQFQFLQIHQELTLQLLVLFNINTIHQTSLPEVEPRGCCAGHASLPPRLCSHAPLPPEETTGSAGPGPTRHGKPKMLLGFLPGGSSLGNKSPVIPVGFVKY